METLTTPFIPDSPHEYFLEFSSKEEYLKKRQEWRDLYKWLSKVIRHNKKADRSYQRAFSLIEHRMIKSQKLTFYGQLMHYRYSCSLSEATKEEAKARIENAKRNIPDKVDERFLFKHFLDAEQLLKTRHKMKAKSAKQRNSP